ncbi:Oxidative stress-induced growth inhibitor 2 [Linnemannia zychae]|nr:Oxidative stress-induced growth inhibitor 2 [Linnemannia zychae]
MFDSLAHPQLDTHRGEYPTFLEWHRSSSLQYTQAYNNTSSDINKNATDILDSPPPTPTHQDQGIHRSSDPIESSTARPHIVLGRGDVGGIWADMEQDHNQTLSYNEHMELPLYSFADFLRDHPGHDKKLDRPLRSTVSAYYKAYVRHMGIQSNFSNYTTVTGLYHLKDLDHHCCCGMSPRDFTKDKRTRSQNQHRRHTRGVGPCQSCAPYRYVVMGYIDLSPTTYSTTTRSKSNRIKFMIKAKTVILATGTFDQPKKLPAANPDPCALPVSPTTMIQQTFHDTRQLEEWMKRHGGTGLHEYANRATMTSPPLSPSSKTSNALIPVDTRPLSPLLGSNLPIVIVGTGLSAADAILLIHEKQPWRRVIHIYKHFSSSEPSPLKRCHRDVYPEYNSIWMRMKRFATLKNSVRSYHHPKEGEQPCRVFGNISGPNSCESCRQLMSLEEQKQDPDRVNLFAPLCVACSYKGLPDASVVSWDPVTGQIVIVLSHGVVIQEQVAAVGVFIGKQIHMGFLKGSLAQEMLSSPLSSSNLSDSSVIGLGVNMGEGRGLRKRSNSQAPKELAIDIPTPPCTPPRSPTLQPAAASPSSSSTGGRRQFWHKQALESLRRCRKGESISASSDTSMKGEEGNAMRSDEQSIDNDYEHNLTKTVEDEDDEDEEETDPSQILTSLNPLVSDMYSFRLIPTGTANPVIVRQGESAVVSSSSHPLLSSSLTNPMTLLSTVPTPTYPTKAKKCTRLPCYPIRQCSTLVDGDAPSSSSLIISSSISLENDSNSENTAEIEKATTISRAATVSNEEASQRFSLSSTANQVGKNPKGVTSSACISMPCSPLLGSRIICPTAMPAPPLLNLCTAAANVLTNSMTVLVPRCSMMSSTSTADCNGTSSSSVSGVSNSSLSSRRSSRCSRSSSISSLALSTVASVETGRAVADAVVTAIDDTGAVVAAAINVANAEESKAGSDAANSIAAVCDGCMITTSDMKKEEQCCRSYSLVEDSEIERPKNNDSEMEIVDEIDVTPYPPPATPAEKLLEPKMDHSIYAAGAITGSKFVRYVLGNGVAIVADILRSEALVE